MDANSNVLAQTTAYIQIVDIKQMYERWTVGDNPTNPPLSIAVPATDGLAAGVQSFRIRNPGNSTTPYILFVHGWNMERWEKDRFAETMFKRLYWQGYQGTVWRISLADGLGIYRRLQPACHQPARERQLRQQRKHRVAIGHRLVEQIERFEPAISRSCLCAGAQHGQHCCGRGAALAGANQVVNTYVASQAAVTAHVYDFTVPNYSFDVVIGGIQFNIGPNTPNIYGDWFAGDNGGGAGTSHQLLQHQRLCVKPVALAA